MGAGLGLPLVVISACLAGGYLLGSIPFGVMVTRLAGLGDIRKVGSGNIGATNVLRTGRKDLALITLVGDGAKGAAAVLIARLLLSGYGHEAAETGAALEPPRAAREGRASRARFAEPNRSVRCRKATGPTVSARARRSQASRSAGLIPWPCPRRCAAPRP